MAGGWGKTGSKQDGDFALAASENDACRQRNQETKKGQFGGGQWEGFRGMRDRGLQIKPYTRHFWQGVFWNIFSFFERKNYRGLRAVRMVSEDRSKVAKKKMRITDRRHFWNTAKNEGCGTCPDTGTDVPQQPAKPVNPVPAQQTSQRVALQQKEKS